jgi:hypothetical protein
MILRLAYPKLLDEFFLVMNWVRFLVEVCNLREGHTRRNIGELFLSLASM